MTSIYRPKTTKNDQQHSLASHTTTHTNKDKANQDQTDSTETYWQNNSTRTFQPPTEVREGDDSFSIYIDLPGLSAQEINITSDTNAVTIQGQRKSPQAANRVINSTLNTGIFERVIQLPQTILEEQVYAEYSHGVLRLELPKQFNPQTSQQELPESGQRMPL